MYSVVVNTKDAGCSHFSEFLYEEFKTKEAAEDWIQYTVIPNKNDYLQFNKYPLLEGEEIELLLMFHASILDYWCWDRAEQQFVHYGADEYYSRIAGLGD